MCAVEHDNIKAVDALLEAGVNVNEGKKGESRETALSEVRSRAIALRLLAAGADPCHLSFEGKRALLSFEPEPDENLMTASADDFRKWRLPRFGMANPECIHSEFWNAMIRSGITGFRAAELFRDEVKNDQHPVWCAQRFGQSITFLPDGRIIQIAGEHEDYYDEDFYIYNDVFVHLPDGKIDIYCYPEEVFPPTDFHSAILLGSYIYIIGALGYSGKRRYGKTPVYRLDIHSLAIETLEANGDVPGWIYKHSAIEVSPHEIRLSCGTLVTLNESGELHSDNTDSFILDVQELTWSRA